MKTLQIGLRVPSGFHLFLAGLIILLFPCASLEAQQVKAISLIQNPAKLLWAKEADMAGQIEPLVSDNRIITFGMQGVVSAYEFDSGQLLWRTELGGEIVPRPSVYNRQLILSIRLLAESETDEMRNFLVRCVNLDDGGIIESFRFSSQTDVRVIGFIPQRLYLQLENSFAYLDLDLENHRNESLNLENLPVNGLGAVELTEVFGQLLDAENTVTADMIQVYAETQDKLFQLKFRGLNSEVIKYQRYQTHSASAFLFTESSVNKLGQPSYYLILRRNPTPNLLLRRDGNFIRAATRLAAAFPAQPKCLAATPKRILTVAGDNSVASLNAELKVKWRKLSSETLTEVCALNDEVALVGAAQDNLLFFSAKNGKLINRISIAAAVQAYFSTHSTELGTADTSNLREGFNLRRILQVHNKLLLIGDRYLALYAL